MRSWIRRWLIRENRAISAASPVIQRNPAKRNPRRGASGQKLTGTSRRASANANRTHPCASAQILRTLWRIGRRPSRFGHRTGVASNTRLIATLFTSARNNGRAISCEIQLSPSSCPRRPSGTSSYSEFSVLPRCFSRHRRKRTILTPKVGLRASELLNVIENRDGLIAANLM